MIAPAVADLVAASTNAAFIGGTPAQQARWSLYGVASWVRFTGLLYDLVEPVYEPLVFEAVRGLAELSALDQSQDRQETLADFDLLKSFGAGSYNETRRDPEEARKAKMLVAWPWLNQILWDFMTEDRRAYWIEFLMDPRAIPATSVTEVDWSRGLAGSTRMEDGIAEQDLYGHGRGWYQGNYLDQSG